jgi:hypothetical protein
MSLGAELNEKFSRDWAHEAQKLLLSLRDIVGADIRLEDDGRGLAEINILAEGHRPPKQIVRDVRSALRAEYQVDVDYRKISVAQRRDMEAESMSRRGESAPTVLTLPASLVEEEPLVTRLRFEGVTVAIDPMGCRVKVELSLEGREAIGEAHGANATRQLPLLVAEATIEALAKFVDPGATLSIADLKCMQLADEETVLVMIKLYKDRSEKTLTGSAVVAQSLQQSVVYATLNALNRVLGRLQFREPIEYEVRPMSQS